MFCMFCIFCMFCMFVCLYVCMFVCLYVCMFVCIPQQSFHIICAHNFFIIEIYSNIMIPWIAAIDGDCGLVLDPCYWKTHWLWFVYAWLFHPFSFAMFSLFSWVWIDIVFGFFSFQQLAQIVFAILRNNNLCWISTFGFQPLDLGVTCCLLGFDGCWVTKLGWLSLDVLKWTPISAWSVVQG